MLTLRHCFQRLLGTEFPLNFPETIFVPIALNATLSEILASETKGSGVMEFLNSLEFFIGCLRQRILERKSKTQQLSHTFF